MFEKGYERAAMSIPKDDTMKTGPCHALLWRQSRYGCVRPIRTLEIDPTQDILTQVKEWAAENDFDVVRHKEQGDLSWPSITTLREKGAPWAACMDLRN
jgi:hypothetical protein